MVSGPFPNSSKPEFSGLHFISYSLTWARSILATWAAFVFENSDRHAYVLVFYEADLDRLSPSAELCTVLNHVHLLSRSKYSRCLDARFLEDLDCTVKCCPSSPNRRNRRWQSQHSQAKQRKASLTDKAAALSSASQLLCAWIALAM